MSDRRAHVKISRRFFEDEDLWLEPRRFSKAEAWIDLIQMASWKPRRFAIGLESVQLQRGEFMASLRFLAERWEWGKGSVARYLAALEKRGHIAGQREGQGGTVYLLVNYDYYQSTPADVETPAGTGPGTPAGHLRDKTEAVKQETTSHQAAIRQAAALWAASRGKPSYPRIGKAMKELVPAHGARQVLVVWGGYLEDRRDKGFCNPEDFVANYLLYRRQWAVEFGEDGSGIPIPDEPVVAA